MQLLQNGTIIPYSLVSIQLATIGSGTPKMMTNSINLVAAVGDTLVMQWASNNTSGQLSAFFSAISASITIVPIGTSAAAGATGSQGPQGQTGPTGPSGGPQGPTGPTGGFTPAYINVYDQAGIQHPSAANTYQAATFNTTGSISGWTVTSSSVFTCNTTGVYSLTLNASTESLTGGPYYATFYTTVGGTAQTASIVSSYTSPNNTNPMSNVNISFIEPITSGQAVSVQWAATSTQVYLFGFGIGSFTSNAIALSIHRIA